MPEHLCAFERIHAQSLVLAADGVVGRWSGYSPSCGWLSRLENASEIGVARRPSRVGSTAGVEPRRQCLPRVEHAACPNDTRNRVNRGHLHGPGRLERVCHAVPRDACGKPSDESGHDQEHELDLSPALRTSTGPDRSFPARRARGFRRPRRRRSRYVVPGRLPRREDTHHSIVEPNWPRLKPLEGPAIGGRFV
jgi:hypothetical protein